MRQGTLGKRRTGHQRPKKKSITWETVRQLALALPGVEDGTSYGTPALLTKTPIRVYYDHDGYLTAEFPFLVTTSRPSIAILEFENLAKTDIAESTASSKPKHK